MTHYIAIVHKDVGSAFGVTFPDIPGCYSAADDSAEVMANAMEALELYCEDLENAPNASSIEQIKAAPDVAKMLSKGAFLISVPLIINARKSARVNITLDKGLLAAIDEVASQRKMTRSSFLAQAAEREIVG